MSSKTSYTQYPADLIVISHSSAPGYGDPIERDPKKVSEDVCKQLNSEDDAENVYRVVLEVDGETVAVREDATEKRFKAIR